MPEPRNVTEDEITEMFDYMPLSVTRFMPSSSDIIERIQTPTGGGPDISGINWNELLSIVLRADIVEGSVSLDIIHKRENGERGFRSFGISFNYAGRPSWITTCSGQSAPLSKNQAEILSEMLQQSLWARPRIRSLFEMTASLIAKIDPDLPLDDGLLIPMHHREEVDFQWAQEAYRLARIPDQSQSNEDLNILPPEQIIALETRCTYLEREILDLSRLDDVKKQVNDLTKDVAMALGYKFEKWPEFFITLQSAVQHNSFSSLLSKRIVDIQESEDHVRETRVGAMARMRTRYTLLSLRKKLLLSFSEALKRHKELSLASGTGSGAPRPFQAPAGPSSGNPSVVQRLAELHYALGQERQVRNDNATYRPFRHR
jgi:hypothetical protein